ncbi:MAG: prenyltransferase [Acidobacteriota bacterium]
MSDIGFLFRVSRPRFWIYIFGPYLVGVAAAASGRTDFLRANVLIYALYFLLPANLLIYGVNDIFDYETDRLNPKKDGYEELVVPSARGRLIAAILVLNVPLLIAAYFLAPNAVVALAGFLFFSIFYSAPPIRAKTKPIVDSAFNILYVFPGIFAYKMISGSFPPLAIIAAAGLWTMAMHAYSAVPDIEADREANVPTVATFLGPRSTLLFCLVLYVASAALAFEYLGAVSVVIGLVYVGMIIASLIETDRDRLFAIYRRFPILNAGIGFAIFWFVALKKLL